MNLEKKIYVFADFYPFDNELIGTLFVSQVRGKELFSFEYNKDWLTRGNFLLDPGLELYMGRQYPATEQNLFGIFTDSCPDRWGRRLMNRREELRARASNEKPAKLMESDFLLGVYDESRMGGLRFKTDIDGDYLANDSEYATPPWTSLRELEQASLSFEEDRTYEEKWLKQLLAPGSSLGGARPKASVLAPDGSLWIAKFPSKNDDFDMGAWEMVAHDLAKMCGLNAPEAQIKKFSSLGSTYLVKRFDREGKNRIHFASAMTMLGKSDGAGFEDGSSYLDIASFIKSNGAKPRNDLAELWKRIVFSMAISNTDDHLRNHGFLLNIEGWVLSPLYDVNPDIYGEYLSLNIDVSSSAIDFDLIISASKYYGIDAKHATEAVKEITEIVKKNWQRLANKYGISKNEIDRMHPAFMKAEEYL